MSIYYYLLLQTRTQLDYSCAMKAATGIFLGLGAYLAYSAWAVANAAKQIRTGVTGVAYNRSKSGLFASEIIVKLNLQNPTRETVSFDSFSGTVSVGTQQLAAVDFKKPAKLTPGDNPLQIPVTIQHLTLGANLVSILKKLLSGQPITDIFNVIGNVYVGGMQLPVTQSIVASAISGPASRNIAAGFIPSYAVTDAAGNRFTDNPYSIGCPDCITPNSSF